MEKIENLNEEIIIEASTEEENKDEYFTLNKYVDIQSKYDEAIKLIKIKMKNTSAQEKIKLPEIKIPIFQGEYVKWMEFQEIFTKVIHNNRNLSDTEKIRYLKNNVQGEAARQIQHYELIGDNYNIAWGQLKQRFENKRHIVSDHVKSIFNASAMQENSLKDLKRLHDDLKQNLFAIKNMGISIESWNAFIVPIYISKLDRETVKQYELTLEDKGNMQPMDEFLNFLQNRFLALEAIQRNKPTKNNSQMHHQHAKSFAVTQNAGCIYCAKQNHELKNCFKFQNLKTIERSQLVNLHNLCRNCLKNNHSTKECKIENSCKKCKGSHDTLLHTESNTPPLKTYFLKKPEGTFLATALVKVRNYQNENRILRGLVDPGSQATFITEDAAQRLRLKRSKVITKVTGIGKDNSTTSTSKVKLTIQPNFESNFKMDIEAFVLKKLTGNLPEKTFEATQLEHIQQLKLADPGFNNPNAIDMIIGVDVYTGIILDGVIKASASKPIAQRSELGWIISGPLPTKLKNIHCKTLTTNQANFNFGEIWEDFNNNEKRIFTKEEEKCEEVFRNHYERDSSGRYQVTLPFMCNPNEKLGDSRRQAVSRFIQIEKRFLRDSKYKSEYQQFMQEYMDLGHMEAVTNQELKSYDSNYYIPHHAVLNELSSTTKFRVVFDASAKTTTGVSLNEVLLNGPTLQQNLMNIILRWRKYKIGITADIEKMFRQVLVDPKAHRFQLIIWRDTPEKPLVTYKLKTVTYGTTPATYLAVRSLQQLAIDTKEDHPLAAKLIQRDFYVDDFVTGADTLEEAEKIQQEVSLVLKTGGFNLRKWTSNNSNLFINTRQLSCIDQMDDIKLNKTIKTLGLYWNSETDFFEFKFTINNSNKKPTKRTILSEASKLFDPLGWLSPTTIIAKLLIQQLWISSIDWDEPVPFEIEEKWQNYKQKLQCLNDIQIPRWVSYSKDNYCEIHGFSDASEKAYAAAVYIKITKDDGINSFNLIAAKSRVAPLKSKQTLPKLELCAAALLAQLVTEVKSTMEIKFTRTFCWTDSKIVLGWINANPHKYRTFVANRIAQIQKHVEPEDWFYIESKHNPADCATRGINPEKLNGIELWWKGPAQIIEDSQRALNIEETELEKKQEKYILNLTCTTAVTPKYEDDLLEMYSDLERLIRISAWCLRFIKNTRAKLRQSVTILMTKYISGSEIETTKLNLIRVTQSRSFEYEIHKIKNNKNLSKSKLYSLSPWLDKEQILRVGGRLHFADIHFNTKHPAILPYKSPLSTLLVDWAHKTTLHGSVNLTLNFIRKSYWIINGKRLVKERLKKCMKCARVLAKTANQMMGQLPKPRVSVTKPFFHTGVDYMGPINLRMSKGRGTKTTKGYVALFICLATKAIHLESASDLTAETFLAAFSRFVARRGNVKHMYSDNATNFTSASKELHRGEHDNKLINSISNLEIEWHFIPPVAPHFGGLWEAGVKSVKNHLKRTIGDTKLTVEEMNTLLCRIEACLNSRPLCPLNDDISDLSVLTPGHFLVGDSLLTPMNDVEYQENDIQNHWKLIQRMQQQFWIQWSKEYLTRLQIRPKWLARKEDIKLNDLVLVKCEDMPSMKWPLARVIEIHSGPDNLVRVVRLKCQNKEIKRPITKICLLPQPTNKDNEDSLEEQESMKNSTSENNLNNTSHTPKYNLRNRQNAKTSLLTFLSIFLLTINQIAQGSPIIAKENTTTIERLTVNSGMFFEGQGKLNILSSEWNIISHYELNEYWSEIKNTKTGIEHLNKVCNLTKTNKTAVEICNSVVELLDHRLKNIRIKNNFIFGTPEIRRKRGLINGVGFFPHEIFGLMDNNDADKINEHLREINRQQNYHLKLISNQTSIIETTANILKHRTEDLQQLQTNVLMLQNKIEGDLFNNGVVQLLVSQLILLMDNYEATQQLLFEVVTDLNHQKVHPLILTLEQFENQLQIIRQHVTATNRLPTNNIHNLVKLVTIRSKIQKNRIIFNFRIPLVQVDLFELFHLVPIPIEHENKTIMLVPSKEYIAINTEKDKYFQWNQAEFSNCQRIDNGNFLCQQPIIKRVTNPDDTCEIGLLTHQVLNSSICNTKETKATQLWISLKTPNSYLYFTKEKLLTTVICGGDSFTQQIEGTGRLKVRDDCNVMVRNSILTTIGKQTSEVHASFSSLSNFKFMLENTVNLPVQQSEISNPNWSTKMEELNNLEDSIQNLKHQEQASPDISHHDVHQYIAIYSIFLLFSFVLLGYLIKRYFKSKARKNDSKEEKATSKPTTKSKEPSDAEEVLENL